MDTPIPRGLLNRAAAAAYLNVPERTARTLFERRAFPTVKIGRVVLVDVADLDAYIAAKTRPAVTT